MKRKTPKYLERTPFFTLPREIRDHIYKLCLFPTEALKTSEEPRLANSGFAVGLLRASKTMHAEACAVFYGQNRLEIHEYILSGKVGKFLQRIGSSAAYIRHVLIPFPRLGLLKRGEMSVYYVHLDIAQSLRRYCPNLQTISTDYSSTYDILELRVMQKKPSIRREALALADEHFRSFPSLKQIIIQLQPESPLLSAEGREEIEGKGWAMCTDDCRREREAQEGMSEPDGIEIEDLLNEKDGGGRAHTVDPFPEDVESTGETPAEDDDDSWYDSVSNSDSDLDSTASDSFESGYYGDDWEHNLMAFDHGALFDSPPD
ncbi:hypothetical protein PG985_014130 [Apiospora marii]|uniref:uncharacterized protein n=1 Tax=Apiospora marii TaxID=335849 RepID=UPI00312E68E4